MLNETAQTQEQDGGTMQSDAGTMKSAGEPNSQSQDGMEVIHKVSDTVNLLWFREDPGACQTSCCPMDLQWQSRERGKETGKLVNFLPSAL